MAEVLVTGANRGLGLEFTCQLLARGDRVIAICRAPGRATALTRLAGEHPGRLVVLALDVGSPRSIADLAHELDRLDASIDLLVNNAGVLPSGERFGGLDARNLAEAFAVNVQGPLLLTQALAAHLADGGKVVALGSSLGSIARADAFGTPSYAISKAALNMAMRQLGHALAARRIAVLSLSPGWVKTDMGGAGANLEVGESVAAMLAVIDRAHFDATAVGAFVSHEGQPLPW